ncbi:MAG: S8 family serine peptidase [Deltaproteobacteria bacterium]|nr:S8 family serine peptidase [Deltaproteobacteria bacterium]
MRARGSARKGGVVVAFAVPLLLGHAGAATGAHPTSATAAAMAPAASTTPHVPPTRIDPALANVFAFRARTGRTPLAYEPNERFEREGRLPVVIRFASPPARAGLLPLASGAYAAVVDAAELARLAGDPDVLRVTCDLPRRALLPLDQSARETGVAGARRALRLKDGTELDGRGTRIADVDSGTFVYHPSLFRADGGVYRWVDVNGDGLLTTGVDGIDLDGNGALSADEKLRLLYVDSPIHASGFDANVDYLFLDSNGNGERDYGRNFGEDAPALGEPIFVVDDVDHDGKLAVSEKLLRLGTSKVAAVRADKTFTRGSASSGVNAYGVTLLRSEELLQYSDHGTAVAGILVGGVPERTRLLGLAPGAELLSITSFSREGRSVSIQWAIDQKADVLLSEYGTYTGFPLDGSTEEELMYDAAVDKGLAVVNPAGNLADAFKHRSVKLVAGPNTFPLTTKYGFDGAPLVEFTVLHRGEPRTLSLKITLPDTTVVDIPAASATVDLEKNRLLTVARRVSPRGTHEIHVEIYALSSTGYGKMPPGRYWLAIDADAPVDVELYCKDSNTSWGYGLVFEQNTPSRTLCHPATDDRGLIVAAYNLHEESGELAGAIARYSSVGPRIDGAAGIDLGSPANPFAPTTPADALSKTVNYAQFSGTSGAGPHVAASLALLKQLNPTKTGAELHQKLLDSARRDSFVDDVHRWGKGKLDLLRALDLPRVESSPPKVKLAFPSPAPLKQPVEIRVEAEGGKAPLRAKWDLDDDGKTEGEWEPLGAKTLSSDVETFKDVKVDVLDADGHLSGATARVVFATPKAPEPPPTPAADPTPPADEAGGCGCSTPGRAAQVWWLAAAVALIGARRRRA